MCINGMMYIGCDVIYKYLIDYDVLIDLNG